MMIIQNRLSKRWKHLKKWAKREQTEAFRLYDRDIPDYPYIIDIYDGNALIYHWVSSIDLEDKKKTHHSETIQALEALGFPQEKQYWKTRKKQSGKSQYQKDTSKELQEFTVQEKQARFKVNLSDYLDTGLFLDHRPMRQVIYKNSKDKKFLNLFCYTASVSVFAALGGAKVTSVDMAQTYLNWGLKNFRLNHLNPSEHRWINANVMDWIEEQEESYDLIFLDPPSFSNSKKMEDDFDIQKDHYQLIQKVIKLLQPKGELYFSTNKRDFKIDERLQEIFTDITKSTIPEDFRNSKIHQVHHYIKG